ncbi:MAG: hypothetical protein KC646_06995 [Candidatus Cloacimonetes bacterium]|nr:hypothetical protein [Candidatus Cloacimonadota bacterium]
MKKALLTALLLSSIHPIQAEITKPAQDTLQQRTFKCKSIKIDPDALDVPSFLKDMPVSNGSVQFEEVNSKMVKVNFLYTIGNFNATHTYHITDGFEYHFMNDLIITEQTSIGDPLKIDPFENSIGTRIKIKRKLITDRVNEIWLRKRLKSVNKPFSGKDIKCKVQYSSGKTQAEDFKKLYKED